MEFFQRAKTVRLKSVFRKFLTTDHDEISIKQEKNGSKTNARWTVEFVEGNPNVIRLKSSNTWKYLCASNEIFLLGMTGKRIVQGSPQLRSDPAVEWEPIREGQRVKLKARNGNFLKANGGVWPWRNSVTHDMPGDGNDEILWVVDLLEFDHTAYSTEPLPCSPSMPVRPFVNEGGRVEFERVASDVSEASSSFSSAGGDWTGSVSSATGPYRSGSVSSTTGPYRSGRPTPISANSSHVPAVQTNNFQPTPNHFETPLQSTDDDEGSYYDTEEDEEIIADHKPLHMPVEVQKALETLEEIKKLDFASTYQSGQLDTIEDAISTLLSHNYRFGPPTQQQVNLIDQIQSLKTQQDTISVEYGKYEKFTEKKSKMNEDIQEVVNKVKQLQSFEEEHETMAREAREKRDELVRKLKEVEEEIKVAEAVVEEDKMGINQLCNLIGKKQIASGELIKEEKKILEKKGEADKKKEKVESDWTSIKMALQIMEKEH